MNVVLFIYLFIKREKKTSSPHIGFHLFYSSFGRIKCQLQPRYMHTATIDAKHKIWEWESEWNENDRESNKRRKKLYVCNPIGCKVVFQSATAKSLFKRHMFFCTYFPDRTRSRTVKLDVSWRCPMTSCASAFIHWRN